MANPVCECGMVKFTYRGITACLHCDRPPQQTITSCYSCRVYHIKVDARVAKEYQAERAKG